MQKRILVLFTLILMLVSACGDLFTTNNDSQSFGKSILGAKCEFDAKEFSKILEKNIKGDIVCLESKLELLLNFVKTDRAGFIAKKTLLELLATDIIDVGNEDITPLVDSLFDISYVLFGGENGYIAERDMNKIIDFLIYFNGNINKYVYKYFVNTEKVNYERQKKARDDVFAGMSLITSRLRAIMKNDSSSRLNSIDVKKVINNFFKKDPKKLEKFQSLMFFKTIFLGGNKFDLTTGEVIDATYKLSDLAQVALDLVQAKNFTFKEELAKMASTYNKGLTTIRRNLFYDYTDDKNLFSIYDVLKAVDLMTDDEDEYADPDAFNLREYPREILVIKEILLENRNPNFNTKDLYQLVNHAKAILDEAEVYFVIYAAHQEELDSRGPMSTDFPNYPPSSSAQERYKRNFTKIVYNYKYFKGNQKSPIFNNDFHRSAAGAVEIRAIEYLAELIMKTYGKPVESRPGEYHMDLDDNVLPLIDNLKRILRDVGLVNVGRELPVKNGKFVYPNRDGVDYMPEIVATGENLVLMSTLFQNQSDGCIKGRDCMSVPEITEFLVGVLTAMSVQSEFNKVLLDLCGSANDGGEIDQLGRNRYSLNCLTNNFLNILDARINDEGESLKKFMPRLYSYVEDLKAEADANPISPEEQEAGNVSDYDKFFNETDAFTRKCRVLDNNQKIKLTEKDAFGIFAGLLNVESTLLRFDINENNKMDDGCDDKTLRKFKGIVCKKTASETDEVGAAYNSVYEGAIKSMVEKKGGAISRIAVKFSKQIFQYLIKYGATPQTTGTGIGSYWHFAKFLAKINRKADASRTTIATILKTLGLESPNSQDFPFKCEECSAAGPDLMCEPHDGISWDYDWTAEDFSN